MHTTINNRLDQAALRQCERCRRPFLQRSIRVQRFCSTRCRVADYRQPELPLDAVTNGEGHHPSGPPEIIAVRPDAI